MHCRSAFSYDGGMDSRFTWTLTVLLLPLAWTGEAAEPAPPAKTYEAAVAPLFATKCGKCHGLEKQSAGLNLSTSAGLQRGAESGAVVVAGKPDESRLFEVLRDGEMPPDGETPLTPAELERVRDWIASGAAVGQSAPVPTVTEQQVVPFLFLRCVPCHGGRRREADLDLRTREGVLRGGKSGPAAIAGKPGESLLVRRIEAEEMPPRRQLVSVSVKPMEANELLRLKNWIAAGLPETPVDPLANGPDRLVSAEDRQFWSFRPLPANPPQPTSHQHLLEIASPARTQHHRPPPAQRSPRPRTRIAVGR